MTTPVFGPGCPWFDLHARFPPNIDWCEEKLCAVIVTPFNSWTNLAYLMVAGVFLLKWLSDPKNREPVDMPEDDASDEVIVEIDADEVNAAEVAGTGSTSDQETAVRM